MQSIYLICRGVSYRAVHAVVCAALILATSTLFIAAPADGGTIADGGALDAGNNDDNTGAWGTNFRGWLSTSGFATDQVIAVNPSGGTTEYSVRLSAILPSALSAVHVELGFGTRSNFVSAASVFSDLDFDAPVPGTPAPRSSALATIRHLPHLIEFSGGSASGVAFGLAEFSIDIPDLPPSVMNYYRPEDIPTGLPQGAVLFTLRRVNGAAVPEPATAILALIAAAPLAFLAKSRRADRQ